MIQKITPALLEKYLLSELEKASLNYDNGIRFKDDEIVRVLGVEKFRFEMLIDAAKSVEKRIGGVAQLEIMGSSVYFHIKRPVGQHPEVEDLKEYFAEKVHEKINTGKHFDVVELENLAYSRGEKKGMKGTQKITLAKNLLLHEMGDKIKDVPGNTINVQLKH